MTLKEMVQCVNKCEGVSDQVMKRQDSNEFRGAYKDSDEETIYLKITETEVLKKKNNDKTEGDRDDNEQCMLKLTEEEERLIEEDEDLSYIEEKEEEKTKMN